MSKPTEDEVREEIDRANSSNEEGSRYPGMTYEEGVVAALGWMLGDIKSSPMEDL